MAQLLAAAMNLSGNMAARRKLGTLWLIAEHKECMQQQFMLLLETYEKERITLAS
jgi:hypothetical protein